MMLELYEKITQTCPKQREFVPRLAKEIAKECYRIQRGQMFGENVET